MPDLRGRERAADWRQRRYRRGAGHLFHLVPGRVGTRADARAVLLPAVLVLAFWFVSQFFSGITAITHASRATGDVAVWAHVAGFILGAASAPFLPRDDHALQPGARPLTLSPARDAPGPARLVSSLADLAALLLAARLVLRFFGQLPPRPPLAVVTVPIVAVTQPVVAPFQELLPAVRILGGVLETATLAAILAVYVLAGLIGQVFIRTSLKTRR